MTKQSSEETASIAGEIMAMAANGGPVESVADELRKEFGLEDGENATLEKIGRVFRPYFDKAESLAASVLSQKEPS